MLDPHLRSRAFGRVAFAVGGGAAGRRARPLLACAVLAVALHLAFLDTFAGWDVRPAEALSAPLSVRTIVPEAPAPAVERPMQVAAPIERPRPAPPARRSAPTEFKAAIQVALPKPSEASAGSHGIENPDTIAPSAGSDADAAASTAADAASAAAAAVAAAASQARPETAAPANAIASAGEPPPPVYPTRLPPAATLRYQVRRGFLRGDGEIRWQPAGDSYRLVLEAHVAGLTLLVQTSEGAIDGTGLAPVRFLDQRARRAAQAANFVRDSGRITFSGTTIESPLVAGSQDRLSWMIQLAGIVAADPALLSEGGRITMAVVGARGDVGVWSLRYVGRETVDTASGSVSAEKLVREGRSANDTTAEIWLDPGRSYLPAHATLRNASGASEYDLLLDRIDP